MIEFWKHEDVFDELGELCYFEYKLGELGKVKYSEMIELYFHFLR